VLAGGIVPPEVAGALVLAVEGILFLLVQEPELVSRMGYLGKYFSALFHGWAAAMSTVASLVLLFLPIILPDKFKDSSAAPASYVWVAGAICFLAANFMIWTRSQKALDEIENARPRLMLNEPGAIASGPIAQTFSNPISGKILKQRIDNFLTVRFINDPPLSVPSSKATVLATIEYYRCSDDALVFSLDGRWSDTTQPSGISPLESKTHLLATTFSQGQKHSLDIAFCDGETGKYYAWNNDNYNAVNEFYVYPAHLLDGERFRIHIRLRGDWVDQRQGICNRTL
jgi:HAMP domain-containing protein